MLPRGVLTLKPKGIADKDISKIVDPDLPVVFVDIPGADSGKARAEEAEVACKIVGALLALGCALARSRHNNAIPRSAGAYSIASIRTSAKTTVIVRGYGRSIPRRRKRSNNSIFSPV